ncbi:MAG: FHA domain-containing protein [Gammaproteobacteria bacterium]|nr:FHA domain-containing protein [Gammaproteobacteria bacterium]
MAEIGMKPRLTVRCDGLVVRSCMLDKARIAIGRRRGNDIQLDDPAVSGVHAVLLITPSEYLESYPVVQLEDAGSTNGTLVNGERIQRRRLHHGDIIRLGQHELVYEENTDAMDSTVFLLSDPSS